MNQLSGFGNRLRIKKEAFSNRPDFWNARVAPPFSEYRPASPLDTGLGSCTSAAHRRCDKTKLFRVSF
jgi:hypothetical protein